jgi:hypothetical protein
MVDYERWCNWCNKNHDSFNPCPIPEEAEEVIDKKLDRVEKQWAKLLEKERYKVKDLTSCLEERDNIIKKLQDMFQRGYEKGLEVAQYEKDQNARLKEALKHISAGTYSSFSIEYKDLCKAMMTIAADALQQLSNQGDGYKQ